MGLFQNLKGGGRRGIVGHPIDAIYKQVSPDFAHTHLGMGAQTQANRLAALAGFHVASVLSLAATSSAPIASHLYYIYMYVNVTLIILTILLQI